MLPPSFSRGGNGDSMFCVEHQRRFPTLDFNFSDSTERGGGLQLDDKNVIKVLTGAASLGLPREKRFNARLCSIKR